MTDEGHQLPSALPTTARSRRRAPLHSRYVPSGAGKGRVYPAESREFRDRLTGAAVRQVTTHPSIHHHPFVYLPAYDDVMHWLVFVSHRTGTPQVFAEERATGQLIQLTDRPDLNEWSIHPSHDGRFVYFTAGSGAWRVGTTDLVEECLAHFGDVPMIPPGMVADAMGTTTLSHNDLWWAVPVKTGAEARLYVVDTQSGECEVIVEAPTIGHPEFHPRNAELLRYAGPYHSRMWVVRRDGSNHRLAYRRDAARKEWIVHEVWNPLRHELLVVNWPHGLIGVDIETALVRQVCSFNAWHLAISRDGRQMVCDTNCPDAGLHLFDPQNGSAAPRLVCESASSNEGAHWRTDHCPYDDGPVRVYAPQHTHPHPNFAPDGTRIVFTSDRTQSAQIYEVDLTEVGPGDSLR